MAASTASKNGKPKGLPRLDPKAAVKPRERREVNLPGIGASVVIEAPSVGAWQATEKIEGSHDRSVALAALCLVEPEMSADELAGAVKDWPWADWVILDAAVADLMNITEEALLSVQREFRGTDN